MGKRRRPAKGRSAVLAIYFEDGRFWGQVCLRRVRPFEAGELVALPLGVEVRVETVLAGWAATGTWLAPAVPTVGVAELG